MKNPGPNAYENIIENLADGLIFVDTGMKVAAFNHAAEEMTEVSREKVLGCALAEAFRLDKWLTAIMDETLREDKIFSGVDGKLHRRISHPLTVCISTLKIFGPEGDPAGAAAFIKDLTGIKSLENESLRKDRLAYIGTFAASVAHEVRNPLGGIKGAAQLLSRRLKEKELRTYTDVIIKESDRLNSIVKDMLNFTRPARLKKKNLNIHKVLDSAIMLLQDGKTPVVKEYDPSLPAVNGDETGLTQVFLNLVKNAKEAAAGKKGGVRVVTRMVTDFHLVRKGSKEAKFVEVEVKDTGCGIPPENMEKIFTPFFTTKHGGSGLGLSISYRIVKEHGGFLRIESQPEKETRVIVYLPIREI